MYVDGEILKNDKKSPLISIYNLPFRDGILEDYASKRGIMNGYAVRTGIDAKTLTVKEIADRAQSGDAAAQSVFSETGAILGECLSPILSEHKIRCVLFGGQISRSFGLMRSSFMSALRDVPTLESVSTVSDFDNATFNGLRSF